MVFLLTFQDEMKVTMAYRNYLAFSWEKASQRHDLLGNLWLPPVEVLAGTCPSSRGPLPGSCPVNMSVTSQSCCGAPVKTTLDLLAHCACTVIIFVKIGMGLLIGHPAYCRFTGMFKKLNYCHCKDLTSCSEVENKMYFTAARRVGCKTGLKGSVGRARRYFAIGLLPV